MKSVILKEAIGPEGLTIVERPVPEPGPGEVVVRVRACSLNYRDLLVTRGGYGSAQKQADLIPLSDGAGEIAALGDGVTGLQVGDRVMGLFFQDWMAGPARRDKLATALGGPIDGMLSQYRVLPARGLIAAPEHLSDVEAACLPCAALTAWSALRRYGNIGPGDRVLTQGTGGVSIFAVQFAKLAGAVVIATSSSDDKLERLRDLGADHVINYRRDENWGKTALALTGGRGVDHVVEVGGAGTLKNSIRAVRPSGMLSMIGVLSGAKHALNLPLIVMQDIRLQGVTVGSRESAEAMTAAMTDHGLHPVVDRVFPLEQTRQAYDYLASGRHFGKVCITL